MILNGHNEFFVFPKRTSGEHFSILKRFQVHIKISFVIIGIVFDSLFFVGLSNSKCSVVWWIYGHKEPFYHVSDINFGIFGGLLFLLYKIIVTRSNFVFCFFISISARDSWMQFCFGVLLQFHYCWSLSHFLVGSLLWSSMFCIVLPPFCVFSNHLVS